MKVKKHIKFRDGSQIWRILISETDKLIIETRNPVKKHAYFSAYNIISSKKMFLDHQLDEKYWIGIEAVYNDIIFFHKFTKPDMPGHRSIIAFDMTSKKILWENEDLTFLFLHEAKVYCYRQLFESREFFTLELVSGEAAENLGRDAAYINNIKQLSDEAKDYSEYIFPAAEDKQTFAYNKLLQESEAGTDISMITGSLEYVKFGNLLLLNYHHRVLNDLLENKFVVYDIAGKKKLMEEILNSSVKTYVPDSFFVYKNFLILLKEKQEVFVYKLE